MTAAARIRCPSDLALEGYLLQPERSPLSAHVQGCAHCGARLARMEAQGEEFNQYVFPATVDAIQEAATPTWRRQWLRFVAPVAALATVGAAAMLMVRVGPSGPPADYVGTKGATKIHAGRAGLKVFMSGDGGARQIEDGSVVPAGASLRFTVKPDDERCFLWMASVDANGQISRLYPPRGVAPQHVSAGPVPGGVVLDGQPGLERVFAVCADDGQTGWEDVRRAASVAVGGPEVLRRAVNVGRPLDAECQSSVLLDKR